MKWEFERPLCMLSSSSMLLRLWFASQARIERTVLQYTQDKAARMPELLLRMEVRAETGRAAAVEGTSKVMEQLETVAQMSQDEVRPEHVMPL